MRGLYRSLESLCNRAPIRPFAKRLAQSRRKAGGRAGGVVSRDIATEVALSTIDSTYTQVPAAAEIPAERRVHPLLYAGKWIAADLLSTLVFVGFFALTHSAAASTGLAIAIGVGQIIYLKRRGMTIDPIQWLSLGLVTVLGGAALVTQDPRFIMLKPTFIYCAVGAVMLRRGWLNRYMPPVALQWSGDVAIFFGYAWAGMMFTTAALNLLLLAYGTPALWAVFLSTFPIASKLGLFAVQYVTTRVITIRRMRAAGVR